MLCRMDSDEDGRTNGEELGDPNCTWKPNNNANFTSGITHPGNWRNGKKVCYSNKVILKVGI